MTISVSTLSNGLRIVTDVISTVETATLGIWVDVGSRHESQALNGVAHVLEHMAFKGTVTRSARDISEQIEAVGGYLNAYTSREITAYHARILKEDVPLALDIIADILQNSIFDKDEFERERSVILQEIGQAYDTPDDIIFDYFQETCFPGQALGRPILGTSESVNSLTAEAVKQYLQDHYGAKQMVLSVAGNVDHDRIVGQAEKVFQSLPSDKVQKTTKAQYKGGDFRQFRDLEQVHITVGFEGISYDHPDYYALSVLSTILGGGMSSRLFQEIREKRGLVYSIYTYASSYKDTGIFGIYAGTGSNQVAELIPVLCAELNKVRDDLKEEEVGRAKAQLKASLMMGLESTSARCETAAQHLLIYGRVLSPQEIVEKIDDVSLADLKQLSYQLFLSKPTLTAIGPIDQIEAYEDFCARLR